MAGTAEQIQALLADAKALRLARDLAGARGGFARSFEQARDAGDIEAMCEAALGLAGVQAYGVHAGRIPAYLFEAYNAAAGAYRVRLAVAIARTWAYSGDPGRGTAFAEEAVETAAATGDNALLAEALDAELLMHWGPDDLADRLRITAQLEDVVAYLPDAESRMSAHLWRLTTALEELDPAAAQRQLSALSRLAEETGAPRVRFFERSRQAMYALVLGDLDAARSYREQSIRAGVEAGEADVLAIEHVLLAEIARQAGEQAQLAAQAAAAEEFGHAEGVSTVLAESADLWLAAGEPDRARSLLRQVAARGLAAIPRALDWPLAISTLTTVAAGTGEDELAAEGLALLEPYAGRGVANGGAVTFAGVVDIFLARAAAALGRTADAARWAGSGRDLARRFGAVWWAGEAEAIRLSAAPADRTRQPGVAVLRPGGGGVWTVGRAGAEVAVREMKGFGYLRLLLRQPGVEISALDLSDWSAGHPGAGVAAETGSDELIDRQALAAYRGRLTAIDEELREAEEWHDPARVDRLRDERDALLAEIGAATGLGGRIRTSGGAAERARVAVRKAVVAAIERVAQVDPVLGRLLTDTVRTGSSCRYDPDPARPLVWHTD
jgi:hypothetical protein